MLTLFVTGTVKKNIAQFVIWLTFANICIHIHHFYKVASSIPPLHLYTPTLPRSFPQLTPALFYENRRGQIANVGFLDVDGHAVSRAIASDTLFIHGSLTGGGGSMFRARGAADASPVQRLRAPQNQGGELVDGCTASCGVEGAGVSTVCDRSCSGGANSRARFGGWMCGAGDVGEYGPHCRACFNDVQVALAVEKEKEEEEKRLERGGQRGRGQGGRSPRRVIMCDTLLPPPSPACTPKCHIKSDTVR